LFPAVNVRRAALCTILFAASARAAGAQTPSPLPTPLPQDQLTLQGRSSVVQGSGARALGMGGAFLARADDATAASWNPAGLSYLRLPEVSFVYAGNRNDSRETNPSTAEVTNDRRRGDGPEFLAATYPLHIGPVAGSAQLSFQRQISFGTDRTIDDFSPGGDTDGTPFTRRTTISSQGGFDVLALGSGWQVTSRLRLGATLNRWLNGYDQISDRPVELGTTHQEFHYGLRGWNVNLGAIWTPAEALNIGLVYKTGFQADLEINKLRRDPFPLDSGEVVLRERTANSGDLGLHPRLDFPAAFGFGASLRPRSAVTISVDYTRTRWSTGVVREFFDLGKTGAPNIFEEPLPYPTLDTRVAQKDTEQIRLGLEYVLIRGRLRLPFRVGYFNDRQYFRAILEEDIGAAIPRTGAPRFDGWTAGAGVVLGRILLDAAYVFERGRYVDLQSTAVHDESHRLFASIIYRHSPH
jgi:long-chain fatty acid transport protein